MRSATVLIHRVKHIRRLHSVSRYCQLPSNIILPTLGKLKGVTYGRYLVPTNHYVILI